MATRHAQETTQIGDHLYRIIYIPEIIEHEGIEYGAKPDPDQHAIFISSLNSRARQRRAKHRAIEKLREYHLSALA